MQAPLLRFHHDRQRLVFFDTLGKRRQECRKTGAPAQLCCQHCFLDTPACAPAGGSLWQPNNAPDQSYMQLAPLLSERRQQLLKELDLPSPTPGTSRLPRDSRGLQTGQCNNTVRIHEVALRYQGHYPTLSAKSKAHVSRLSA